MTEKLFYADPFLVEFTAQVLSCVPEGEGFAVTLDRTAFYPEGGGQNADHGVLGGAAVTHVKEKDGEILHLCDHPSPWGTPSPGPSTFPAALTSCSSTAANTSSAASSAAAITVTT